MSSCVSPERHLCLLNRLHFMHRLSLILNQIIYTSRLIFKSNLSQKHMTNTERSSYKAGQGKMLQGSSSGVGFMVESQ